jgi:capsular polysaccharide export protein
MPNRTLAFIDPGMRLTPYLCVATAELPASVRPVFLASRPKPSSMLRRFGHVPAGIDTRGLGAEANVGHAPDIDAEALMKTLRLQRDRDAVAGCTRAYRAVERSVRTFLDDQAPDGIFCWNGSGLAAGLATQIARHRGIPVAFGENGYLPGTMQLDPLGVNAAASFGPAGTTLARILERTWTEQQCQSLEALLEQYRRGQRLAPRRGRPPGLRASPLAYLQQAILDLRTRASRPRMNRPMNSLVPAETPALPERFLFFPLQVRQDSQLTVHSPVYGPRLDLAIEDLVAALAEVAPGLQLVVKLHPADRTKTDYDPLITRFPDVVWIGSGDVRDILRTAAAVVTVNSTVGVEGLVFNKPVVVLGDAVYGFDALVHLVRERTQLADALSAALSAPTNGDRVSSYLRYLYFDALTHAHLNDYSEASTARFRERLIEVLWGPTPGG